LRTYWSDSRQIWESWLAFQNKQRISGHRRGKARCLLAIAVLTKDKEAREDSRAFLHLVRQRREGFQNMHSESQ